MSKCSKCNYEPITGQMCDNCIMKAPLPYLFVFAGLAFACIVALAMLGGCDNRAPQIDSCYMTSEQLQEAQELYEQCFIQATVDRSGISKFSRNLCRKTVAELICNPAFKQVPLDPEGKVEWADSP